MAQRTVVRGPKPLGFSKTVVTEISGSCTDGDKTVGQERSRRRNAPTASGAWGHGQ